MVMCFHTYDSRKTTFQYSLCRVVLMVLVVLIPDGDEPGPFSTRSVESF